MSGAPNETTARATAERIADYLFTNGAGDHAERLVLATPDGRDGGGWSKPAVVDAVERILMESADVTKAG